MTVQTAAVLTVYLVQPERPSLKQSRRIVLGTQRLSEGAFAHCGLLTLLERVGDEVGQVPHPRRASLGCSGSAVYFRRYSFVPQFFHCFQRLQLRVW